MSGPAPSPARPRIVGFRSRPLTPPSFARVQVKPAIGSDGIAHTGLSSVRIAFDSAVSIEIACSGFVPLPLRSIQRPSQPVLTFWSLDGLEPDVRVVEVAEVVLLGVDRGHDREVRAGAAGAVAVQRVEAERLAACGEVEARVGVVAAAVLGHHHVGERERGAARAGQRLASRRGRRRASGPGRGGSPAARRRRTRSRSASFGTIDVQAVVAAGQVEQHEALVGRRVVGRGRDRLPDRLPAELLGRRRPRPMPATPHCNSRRRVRSRGVRPAGKPSSAAYGTGIVCDGRASRTRASSISSHSMQRTYITCPSGPPRIIACSA